MKKPRGKSSSPSLTTVRDDYPNFAFWEQRETASSHSETGQEIVQALAEIDRLRTIVDILRTEFSQRGIDPDAFEYPPPQ